MAEVLAHVPPPSIFLAGSIDWSAEVDPTDAVHSDGDVWWTVRCVIACEHCQQMKVACSDVWYLGDRYTRWSSVLRYHPSEFNGLRQFLTYRFFCSVACGLAIAQERQALMHARQAYKRLCRMLRRPGEQRRLCMLGEIPGITAWPHVLALDEMCRR